MKRAVLALVATVAGLVALLSFKTHPIATRPPAALSTATAGDTGSSDTTTPSDTSTPSASTTAQAKTAVAKTFTGSSADTRYGPVQVKVTVKDGKVVAAEAVDYPTSDPRDAQINSRAIPILNDEATRAGNANIDFVSGATFTSDGYIRSLQSALDKAGL